MPADATIAGLKVVVSADVLGAKRGLEGVVQETRNWKGEIEGTGKKLDQALKEPMSSLRSMRGEMRGFSKDMKFLMMMEGMGKQGLTPLLNMGLSQLGGAGLALGLLNQHLGITDKLMSKFSTSFGPVLIDLKVRAEEMATAWEKFGQAVRGIQLKNLEMGSGEQQREAAIEKKLEDIDPGGRKPEAIVMRDKYNRAVDKVNALQAKLDASGSSFSDPELEKAIQERDKVKEEAKEAKIRLVGPRREDAAKLVDEEEKITTAQRERRQNLDALEKYDQRRLEDQEKELKNLEKENEMLLKQEREEMIGQARVAQAREDALEKWRGDLEAHRFESIWEKSQAALEGLKTPQEKLVDQIKEYDKWLEEGVILEEDRVRLVDKATQAIHDQKVEMQGAAEAGSAEARARVAAFRETLGKKPTGGVNVSVPFHEERDQTDEILSTNFRQMIEVLKEIRDEQSLANAANDPVFLEAASLE